MLPDWPSIKASPKGVDALARAILLSLPRGPVGERYGRWERFNRWPDRRITT